MSKLKILLFGQIDDKIEVFVSKLKSLQSSKAGPFDAAFCVGICRLENVAKSEWKLPIPVYLHQVENTLDLTKHSDTSKQDDVNNSECVETSDCLKLEENLYVLRPSTRKKGNNGDIEPKEDPKSTGIWNLKVAPNKPELVVVSCCRNFRADERQAKDLIGQLNHVSYRGCDLLLSNELPQGAEQLIQTKETDDDEKLFVKNNISFDVADVALKARARYHLIPGRSYHQSAPFDHLASATSSSDNIMHVGRLISLAPISASKEKTLKCVHALGLTPLIYQSLAERQAQRPAQLLPCPFTDAVYEVDQHHGKESTQSFNAQGNSGLSEASARRIMGEERQKLGISRWATGQKRPRAEKANDGEQDDSVDPEIKSLFVHGLHKDVTGQLQSNRGGDLPVLSAFPGARSVRRPPGAATSSFCFVDFDSHEAAKLCLEQNPIVVVNGIELSVKWATQSNKKSKTDNKTPANSFNRLTEAEAKDSSSVYFRIPHYKEEDISLLGEALRIWAEITLENALAGDDDGDRITAAEEPALRVELRIIATEKHYGFLDFASHAAASMVLATLTGSTDGGAVVDGAAGHPDTLQQCGKMYLHWARPKPDIDAKEIIQDASGFAFERKHFPVDARQNCWFCLASDSCEKHLITGVFDTCYAAMPKGHVHEGHVLLIPVQHTSAGALKDPAVSKEIGKLKDRLRSHAASAYEMDLFVFERAIETKGGYHTHVQCIPIQRNLGLKLQATMIAQARKLGMDILELNSDLALSAVLENDDEDEGYFFAEIPVGGTQVKRFLYKAKPTSSVRVPLQFGREIIAAVMEKPELAHWKSCVLDEEKEKEMAEVFRRSIAES